MHTVSAAYLANLKTSVALRGTPRLFAEWNYNRYAGPPTVVCPGATNPDTDEFPLQSVVLPNRPQRKGLPKARATNRTSWIANSRPTVEGYVQNSYDDSSVVTGQRSYTVSADSKFKYWSSPTQSAPTPTTGIYLISNAALEVTYTRDISINKVVAVFENSSAYPKNITVSYKTSPAGAWVAWPGTFQVGSDGVLALYTQPGSTLSSTRNLGNLMTIRGLKISVLGMSGAKAHLGVLEVSARLELDLSAYVIDYSVNNTMSETSLVAPMGACSSNEASVTLDNTNGNFDNDRVLLRDGLTSNILHGIVDSNVRMTMDLGVNVNGSLEYTRQFTMWADEWGHSGEHSVVSLKDSSKILQERKPNAILLKSVTTAGAAWRLCDSVGFSDYSIITESLSDLILDYYWTDPEKTVWEHLQDISEATQTAFYFDEYDMLQVRPRTSAYRTGQTPAWTFDADNVGTSAASQGRSTSDNNKLADIVELESGSIYDANIVNVRYAVTTAAAAADGTPTMEEVWGPEDTMTLRSSRLVTSVSPTDDILRIAESDSATWPHSGYFQIEGEIVKYDAKRYAYFNASGVLSQSWVESREQQQQLDRLYPLKAFQNHYDGALRCTGGRGAWGTTAKSHSIGINKILWGNNSYRNGTGSLATWSGGVSHDSQRGRMVISGQPTWGPHVFYAISRGIQAETPPVYYGSMISFSSARPHQAGGIFMSAGSGDSGYFVEVLTTALCDAGSNRSTANEIALWVRYSNGTKVRIGPNGGKGVPYLIMAGIDYQIDVSLKPSGTDHIISIMVNGRVVSTITVPLASQPAGGLTGRYGLFTRWDSIMEAEYFYTTLSTENPVPDNSTFFDRITGGFQSSQLTQGIIYDMYQGIGVYRYSSTTNKNWLIPNRYDNLIVDEFGPVVHEVREMDVKFDKTPVLNSRLYVSNDMQSVCPEYISTPFGAKFIIANKSRVNAILNGEDTLTFGSNNPVNQKIMIYGRVLSRSDEQVVTVRDEPSINRRGAVELDITSDWIQSEASAKAIGEWITSIWGGDETKEEVTLTSVGNPLIQVGDIVAIVFSQRGMTYTANRYCVVGISGSFDGGLESTFTLRRIN